jgi:hypothetical protein
MDKVAKGVKAVMSGMNIPELQDEIDRLRTRKGELENAISHIDLIMRLINGISTQNVSYRNL